MYMYMVYTYYTCPVLNILMTVKLFTEIINTINIPYNTNATITCKRSLLDIYSYWHKYTEYLKISNIKDSVSTVIREMKIK
jgi:hypothetical protein